MKNNTINTDSDREDDGFVESNLLNEFNDSFIDDESPLVSCDQMMPILNPIEDDVDSLFDELERLLAPEEILQSLNPVTYNLYYINTSHILMKRAFKMYVIKN